MMSTSWRLMAVSILLALGALACRGPTHPSQVMGPRGEDAVPDRSLEKEAPAEELNINIEPRRLSSSGLLLRLCFSGNSKYDPEIHHIRVAQLRGGTAVCDIRSIEGGRLCDEWEVGTVPPGFGITKCDKLSPGEYEISAEGVLGDGQIRLAIDPSGSVERLPWDKHDALFRETCKRRSGAPNFIPVRDEGLAEGGLSQRIMRAREAKERRSGSGSARAPADPPRK
jgi:hypothetical protein